MGWWKIKDETGMIDWDNPPMPGKLINAVPGRDSKDLRYNGDGPADVMGIALKKINDHYQCAWGRPAYREELLACFNFVANGMFQEKPTVHPDGSPIEEPK